jgi:hypothetical protein
VLIEPKPGQRRNVALIPGAYTQRHATDCLRLLTVTTIAAWPSNLLSYAQEAAGGCGAAYPTRC